MKKIKILIGIALLVVSGFIAFGLCTLPYVQGADSESFSAERVAKDIEVISQKPHSFEDPQALSEVRNYLYQRLYEMGGDPEICYYDSIKCRLGGHIDIGNVYCTFDPIGREASSYVMLIAHMDSRFRQPVLKDTVYSFGAADDGYGLGVILETVSQALKYRNTWNQGIKVLFTDAEENKMDGILSALKYNNNQFDNVGLVFNVEARGVKGAALLFETSSNNAKLIELYRSQAKYHYTYSLTTVVYNILPTFTDFTPLKDIYPGLNLSVIDNLNYYHTDKDNFSNINLRSIQHYGAQMEPIINEYLTNNCYADPDYLKADSDKVFFSVPGFNLFRFTKGQYSLFNAIIFAIFCIAFAFHLLARSIKIRGVLKNGLYLFLTSIGVLAIGEGIAYLSAAIVGTRFNIVETCYIKYDYIISIASFVLLAFFYILFFIKKKANSKFFVRENLFGAMLVMVVFSALLFFTIGENFFFLIPLALAAIAMIFYQFILTNVLSLPALLGIVLLELSFLYNLLTALSIGSLGVVMFIAFYSIVLVVGLFDCFLNQSR